MNRILFDDHSGCRSNISRNYSKRSAISKKKRKNFSAQKKKTKPKRRRRSLKVNDDATQIKIEKMKLVLSKKMKVLKKN